MLLLSSKDVHTRNNKYFSHRRSSCCRLFDRSSRCRSFGEKMSKLCPAVRDQRWWLRGAYIFEGKCIFENKPPPQSRSCLLLKKGGLFSGGYGTCIRCSSGLALFVIAYTPLCSNKYYLWVGWGKGKLVIIVICYQFIITFNDNNTIIDHFPILYFGGGGRGWGGLTWFVAFVDLFLYSLSLVLR